MLRILKGIATFFFFVAALNIVMLPVCKVLFGPAAGHYHPKPLYMVGNKKATNAQLSAHGAHDTIWELIKRRSLTTPPISLKGRSPIATCLLIGLFFFSFTRSSSKLSAYRLNIGTNATTTLHKYLFNQAFLI